MIDHVLSIEVVIFEVVSDFCTHLAREALPQIANPRVVLDFAESPLPTYRRLGRVCLVELVVPQVDFR